MGPAFVLVFPQPTDPTAQDVTRRRWLSLLSRRLRRTSQDDGANSIPTSAFALETRRDETRVAHGRHKHLREINRSAFLIPIPSAIVPASIAYGTIAVVSIKYSVWGGRNSTLISIRGIPLGKRGRYKTNMGVLHQHQYPCPASFTCSCSRQCYCYTSRRIVWVDFFSLDFDSKCMCTRSPSARLNPLGMR